MTLGELFKSQGYATGLRRQVAPRGERAELADPPGLRRVPRGRHRDHGRHPVPRRDAATGLARGRHRRRRAGHLGIRGEREPEEGAALHRGLPPAGGGRHRQGVGGVHRAPGQGEETLLPLRRLDAHPLPDAAGAGVRRQVAHRRLRRRDHGARLPHRPGARRDQGRRRRGQHHRALALGQRGRADRGPASTRAAARTARSAASSATRWRDRSARSA